MQGALLWAYRAGSKAGVVMLAVSQGVTWVVDYREGVT